MKIFLILETCRHSVGKTSNHAAPVLLSLEIFKQKKTVASRAVFYHLMNFSLWNLGFRPCSIVYFISIALVH